MNVTLHWLVENCTHWKDQPNQNFWKTQTMELMISLNSAHSTSGHMHLWHMYPHFFIPKWVRAACSGCLVPISGTKVRALYLGAHPNSTSLIFKVSVFINFISRKTQCNTIVFCGRTQIPFLIVWWVRLIVPHLNPESQRCCWYALNEEGETIARNPKYFSESIQPMRCERPGITWWVILLGPFQCSRA